MLLHVVQAAIPIDSAVDGLRGNAPRDNMDHLARLFFLKTIDQRRIVESSQVVGLATGGRIKRGLIQNYADFITNGLGLNDIRVELEKIRIVVVKAFRFHKAFN